ncbi:MAG: VanZ family protein [Bacteroidales bacterium]|nr:VanZ family protein [Bacteroidales bacterium]
MFQKIYKFFFCLGYLAILITAFIPVAGSLNRVKVGRGIFEIRLDHLLHIAAYFLICLYYLFGQRKGLMLFKKNSLLKFILLILLLATVSEVVQLWVPGRAFNPADLLANVTGILLGVGVILGMKRKVKSEKKL